MTQTKSFLHKELKTSNERQPNKLSYEELCPNKSTKSKADELGLTTDLMQEKIDIPDINSLDPELIFSKKQAKDTNIFTCLQKWEGTVLSVSEKIFDAKLNDLSNENNPDEYAELKKFMISNEQSKLLEPGAIFYWYLGYLDQHDGRRIKNIIIFKRAPTWTKKMKNDVLRTAKQLNEFLNSRQS